MYTQGLGVGTWSLGNFQQSGFIFESQQSWSVTLGPDLVGGDGLLIAVRAVCD